MPFKLCVQQILVRTVYADPTIVPDMLMQKIATSV